MTGMFFKKILKDIRKETFLEINRYFIFHLKKKSNQKLHCINFNQNRDRIKSNRHAFTQNLRQQQTHSSTRLVFIYLLVTFKWILSLVFANRSDLQPPESPSGESTILRPPPLPIAESMSQHVRHPSGSSRVGTALSDAGSISSSGSFQSAASMQSDQSMHSIHSHSSMQSVHGQQAHQGTSSFRSANQSCSGNEEYIIRHC